MRGVLDWTWKYLGWLVFLTISFIVAVLILHWLSTTFGNNAVGGLASKAESLMRP